MPLSTVCAPMGGSDLELVDAVTELRLAVGMALGRKRSANILVPHRYVIGGNKIKKVPMEEDT